MTQMYKFNEEIFLATIYKNKKIYFAVKEIVIKSWFFKENRNYEIWAKINDLIEKVSFDSFKGRLVDAKGEFAKNYDVLMRMDVSGVIKEYEEDDNLFMNDIKFYREERRRSCLASLNFEIEKRISKGEPYADVISSFQDLNDDKDIADEKNAIQIVEDMMNETEAEVFKTGLQCFDKITKIGAGQLFVIAGESSAGKTSWMIQIVYNYLRTTDYKGILYSLETNHIKIGQRMAKHICMKRMCDEKKASEHIKQLADRLVVIKTLRSVESICENIRKQIKKDDSVKFIVVDYLQIVQSTSNGFMEETQRVGFVTDQFHQITQETGVLFILLCQLRKQEYSKDGGERKRNAPTMQELRGSGQIVNCADVITINWCPSLKNTGDVKEMFIELVKQKDGPTGQVKCDFIGSHFTFQKAGNDE